MLYFQNMETYHKYIYSVQIYITGRDKTVRLQIWLFFFEEKLSSFFLIFIKI